MRKVVFFMVLHCAFAVQAQVGIGTTTPQGALDIVSTNDTGVVIPRVSSIRNVTDGQGNPPVNGTLVFDISQNAICFYQNQNWSCINFGTQGQVGVANSNIYYESSSTYIKASNSEAGDNFGDEAVLSADGNTLVVSARSERSNATGINGDQTNNGATISGAVYVFVRVGSTWSQQAYIKASNTETADRFGSKLSISDDGNTLAVTAVNEDSNATGINGNQADNSALSSGAVYLFVRSGVTWSQQAYIKASNAEEDDEFGRAISLSSDGNTLAVGAPLEGSNATGINGNQTDNSALRSGAAYVFTRTGVTWTQQAYIKSSNAQAFDFFGASIAISDDGNTLAVGAIEESSNATGINGDQTNNLSSDSGAVYVFNRSGSTWSQQDFIKASNTGSNDNFGISLSISGDGNTLAVGAHLEDSNAMGIDGDQTNNFAGSSGAVYVFVRPSSSWSQQAYIKASNTESGDFFGDAIALSSDGNTLAVGARQEGSNDTIIDGDQTNNDSARAGAVYVFGFSGATWAQRAYVKSTNTNLNDLFGASVALSANGDLLISGAYGEASNATGINGDQTNNTSSFSGALYVYEN